MRNIRFLTHLPSGQTILIYASVVNRLNRFKQGPFCGKEAGGQLFGQVIDNEVHVRNAVGPRVWDERTRTSFRSDPRIAQEEIERQSGNGFLYLGEWHTHAERFPQPSTADKQTMESILARSTLNVNALLLFIRGTADLPRSLGIYYFSSAEQISLRLKKSCHEDEEKALLKG